MVEKRLNIEKQVIGAIDLLNYFTRNICLLALFHY